MGAELLFRSVPTSVPFRSLILRRCPSKKESRYYDAQDAARAGALRSRPSGGINIVERGGEREIDGARREKEGTPS